MKYAYFDPNSRVVLGWIDTEAFHYDQLPPEGQLVKVTDDQYELRDNTFWISIAFELVDKEPVTEISLAEIKAARLIEVNEACSKEIVSGFTSPALGANYTYPSKSTDQANLQARTLAALINATTKGWKTQFWCADAAGVWAYRDHTSAQMQEVGQAGDAWIGSCIAKKIVKEALITAATTAEAALAITWDSDDAAETEAAAGAAA